MPRRRDVPRPSLAVLGAAHSALFLAPRSKPGGIKLPQAGTATAKLAEPAVLVPGRRLSIPQHL